VEGVDSTGRRTGGGHGEQRGRPLADRVSLPSIAAPGRLQRRSLQVQLEGGHRRTSVPQRTAIVARSA
jgi:hypothetical protein